MKTVNDIKQYYESVEDDYKEAKREYEKAKDRFNLKYNELSEGAYEIIDEFTKELFNTLVSKLDNVADRNTYWSRTLTEIHFDGGGMDKISFHNKYYINAYQPEFTYMFRDAKMRADNGIIPMDMTGKEAAEFLYQRYQEFKNK